LLTIAFAPLSAGISYFINKALASWGILDTYASQAGAWLLVHIPPQLALDLLTTLIGLTLYGGALGVIWYRRKGPTDPPPVLHKIEYANDEPLWKAVQHVAVCIGEATDARYFPRARAALRQKALDGKLKIRGKKQLQAGTNNFDSVYTDVPLRYWEEFQIGPVAAVEHTHTDMVFTMPVSGAFLAWRGSNTLRRSPRRSTGG